jgi:hypothetical protein
MIRGAAFLCFGLIACAPAAVSPPARTFALESAMTPAAGHNDLQLDIARGGQFWGPDLTTGGGRLRQGIGNDVALETDGEILHLNNPGTGGDRNAFVGRLGIVAAESGHHAAITAGAGAGHSAAAGDWGSADLGAVVNATNPYVRPVLAAGFGYSAQIGRKTFTVSYDQSSRETLQLPRNAFFRVDVGLEFGPPDTAFFVGMSALHFWLLQPDDLDGAPHMQQDYAFLGLGTRIALD